MPFSRCLAMFSSTTIESSTTMPVASARPPSDITLRLSPSWPMKKKVAMIETGSDSAMTKVLQPSRRKKKMIRIASTPPIARLDLDLVSALLDELGLVLDVCTAMPSMTFSPGLRRPAFAFWPGAPVPPPAPVAAAA